MPNNLKGSPNLHDKSHRGRNFSRLLYALHEVWKGPKRKLLGGKNHFKADPPLTKHPFYNVKSIWIIIQSLFHPNISKIIYFCLYIYMLFFMAFSHYGFKRENASFTFCLYNNLYSDQTFVIMNEYNFELMNEWFSFW